MSNLLKTKLTALVELFFEWDTGTEQDLVIKSGNDLKLITAIGNEQGIDYRYATFRKQIAYDLHGVVIDVELFPKTDWLMMRVSEEYYETADDKCPPSFEMTSEKGFDYIFAFTYSRATRTANMYTHHTFTERDFPEPEDESTWSDEFRKLVESELKYMEAHGIDTSYSPDEHRISMLYETMPVIKVGDEAVFDNYVYIDQISLGLIELIDVESLRKEWEYQKKSTHPTVATIQ